MTTKLVKRHFCEFCHKGKFSKPWMERHERHCYKNPGRVPYEGELSFVGQTGRYRNYGGSDDLPDGLSWIEWQEYDEMPNWWPGDSGMIFHDGEWHVVEGYRRTPAKGAHGCAGGACDVEEWPKRLNEIPAASRWEHLTRSTP